MVCWENKPGCNERTASTQATRTVPSTRFLYLSGRLCLVCQVCALYCDIVCICALYCCIVGVNTGGGGGGGGGGTKLQTQGRLYIVGVNIAKTAHIIPRTSLGICEILRYDAHDKRSTLWSWN